MQTRELARLAHRFEIKDLVTDIYWFGEEHADLWREFAVREVVSAAELQLLTERLHEAGRRRFALVLSPLFRQMSSDVVARVARIAQAKAVLEPNGLEHLRMVALVVPTDPEVWRELFSEAGAPTS